MTYIGIILTFTLINNVVFSQLLGVCTFFCEEGNGRRTIRLGAMISVAAALTAGLVWLFQHGVLVPLGATILLIPSVVLIAAAVSLLLGKLVSTLSPRLSGAFGDSFPLLFSDCVVVAVALTSVRASYTVLESVVAGLAAGLGFSLAGLLLSSIKGKLDIEDVPESFRGAPIMFITAGLMALAFMAFDRALLSNLVG